jgi:hypothetical protein
VKRIEDVLDKDGRVFLEEIWYLSLAQRPNRVHISIMP